MKAFYLISAIALGVLIPTNSWGETAIEENSAQKDNTNICANFAPKTKTADNFNDVPAPVRTLNNDSAVTDINVSEEIFYQQLGLIPSRDGSYVCVVTDPDNNRRKFTLFKVQRIDNIVVASTFLDRGKFLAGQEQAISDLFLEMIQFYTDLPEEYYPGVNNYFQEFYLRMADGRLKPSSDRVYAVDEPSSTVIMYHPSVGEFQGTVISLNIPLL